MSKLQNLPQKVLDAVIPYLLTGEVIDKSIIHDNKKVKEIWIIKTNQAIIFYGQQSDKLQPSIMVMALDEMREIDYLQKKDDIQIIFYSTKNNGKAVFHFEASAAKDLETFFDNLGDIITYRYQTEMGKITVVQRALRIGDKDRRIFGRGKAPEASFLAKSLIVRQNDILTKPAIKTVEKPSSVKNISSDNIEKTLSNTSITIIKEENKKTEQKTKVSSEVKSTETLPNNTQKEEKNKKQDISNREKTETLIQPKLEKEKNTDPIRKEEKIATKDTNIEPKDTTTKNKTPEKTKVIEKQTKPSIPSIEKEVSKTPQTDKQENTSNNDIKPQKQENQSDKEKEEEEEKIKKPEKEIDYGSPVYFIGITLIATIIGFLSLTLFKTISRIVRYFKR